MGEKGVFYQPDSGIQESFSSNSDLMLGRAGSGVSAEQISEQATACFFAILPLLLKSKV
jgi:hypothetical protein